MNKALCVFLALCLGMGGLMIAPAVNSETVGVAANALTPHAPIRINNNTDFITLGFNGTGSAADPWVIENYDINGTGNGTCIYIGNTTDFFELRNCVLHNANGGTGSIYYFDSSLMLFNTTHGTILNNTLTASQYGIYLRNDSKNNTLINNKIHQNSDTGILMDIGSEGNDAANNSIYANGLIGIYVYKGHTNFLRFNDIHDNGHSGIYLYSTDTNYVLNCTVHNNTAFGIHIYSGSFMNWVLNCTIADNGYGVRIYNSAYNVIYRNDFINNTNNAYDDNVTNDWDGDYINGGNYWDDYTGQDLMGGTGQDVPGSDGFGDAPYTNIDGGVGQNDTYPLMSSFNSTVPLDTLPPQAVSWGPIGNQTGYSAGIFILWNEIMNWTSVESAFSFTDGTTNWSGVNGTWNHDPLTHTSNFDPQADFEYDTQYFITMNCTAADLTGNLLDQNGNGTGGEWPGDALYWNFTSVALDLTPPSVLNYSPNGTEVSPATKILITWNETMNWTSVEAAFSYTDGITNWSSANGSWTHDPLTNTSSFDPDGEFEYETQYYVTVNCTAIDMNGNALDQDGNGTGGCWPADVLAWNFTITDEAPYVMATTPANGQVDVDPFKPIKIMFSEAMNRTSVEAGFSYTNGTETWDDADGVVYWNAMETEFTYSPAETLPLNQTFTATLNGTLARDAGGKLLEGGDYSWSFTTWLEPPAPHITDTYPPAGSFNVNVNTYINIAFDTEMDPASMVGAFSYTDGVDVWDVTSGTVDWFSENSLFSFQPIERLHFDTAYTVRVTANATSIYGQKLDGNDNGIPDIADDFVFAFSTTLEPPTVLSHYPEANQMEVSISLAAININFTKVMSATTVTNAVSIYPSVPFMPSFSGSGMNLTLVLGAELLEGTQYRVTVLGTATDEDGIKLDGNSDGWAGDKFSFSFITTGLVVPIEPHVISIFPGNNATEVPVESYVGIAFNVAMNRTSVQEAFSFGNATTKLNGTFLWQANSKSFRFIPTEPLSFNMTYYVTLQGTAKDEDGRPLVNDTAWQFITVADTVPTDWTDWIIYGVIIFLVVMVVILYMANRSLRRDLKRTRVKLKKLKRELGLKDGEPDEQTDKLEQPPEPEEPESKPDSMPEDTE